jgi:outer membrane protein assembly factor BamB
VVGESGDRALGTPAVARNVVYCVDASRRVGESTLLRAYDAATGEERWRFEAGQELHLRGTAVAAGVGSLRSSPAVIGGVLYVGSNEGSLRAVGGAQSPIRTRARH